jgi:hypothetical protein
VEFTVWVSFQKSWLISVAWLHMKHKAAVFGLFNHASLPRFFLVTCLCISERRIAKSLLSNHNCA